MVFNFHSGKTATKIKELTKSEIIKTSNYHFEPINNIDYNKIISGDKRFFYSKGDDIYLMFAYKKQYFTIQNGLPVFHVCKCKTIRKFSDFSYANAMPVEIYCSDQKKTLEQLQNLHLCYNCISNSQKGFYSFLAKGKPWFEYVIEYANSNNEIAKKTKPDGYVVMWKQISEAIREKYNFKCERCNIELNENKYYLEVHHKDYKKTNNKSENLECLCVLCHATTDEKHLINYKKNEFKVDSYVKTFEEYIKNKNLINLQKWHNCV